MIIFTVDELELFSRMIDEWNNNLRKSNIRLEDYLGLTDQEFEELENYWRNM